MDQSLVHTFSWGNSYGPMVLKVLPKFPPTLVLVHGWLFPVFSKRSSDSRALPESRDTQLSVPRNAIRKRGVQFRNPQASRENQTIRA